MGKYICPYCGELEDFIVKTEKEDGITFEVEVRCGHCYSVLNDANGLGAYNKKEYSNRDKNSICKKSRVSRNVRKISNELIAARRARYNGDNDSAAALFAECEKKYPFNWESVFYNTLYIAKNNQPIQNVTYYKVFAAKMYYALQLAAGELDGAELIQAVKEIAEESIFICSKFEKDFIEIANDYLNGYYPDSQRTLVSMDTSLIYDLLSEFLCSDISLYSDILLSLNLIIITSMGARKSEYLPRIVNIQTKASWRYPIEYSDCFWFNKTFLEALFMYRIKPVLMK